MDEGNGESDHDRGFPFHKKTIGEHNWKQSQTKRLREQGQGYLGRSKKNAKTPARSLGGRCSCEKNGYQCNELSDEE